MTVKMFKASQIHQKPVADPGGGWQGWSPPPPPPPRACPDTENLCKVCVWPGPITHPLECRWRHTGNVQGGEGACECPSGGVCQFFVRWMTSRRQCPFYGGWMTSRRQCPFFGGWMTSRRQCPFFGGWMTSRRQCPFFGGWMTSRRQCPFFGGWMTSRRQCPRRGVLVNVLFTPAPPFRKSCIRAWKLTLNTNFSRSYGR